MPPTAQDAGAPSFFGGERGMGMKRKKSRKEKKEVVGGELVERRWEAAAVI